METQFQPRPKLTYADYARIPEDGKRHEIIDGAHYVNPAQGTYHQKVSRRIQFQRYEQIELPGRGEVYDAPTDLQLSEHDIVQPDLVVVLERNSSIITPTKIEGIPDLVIEITSKSSVQMDRVLKRDLYRRSGSPEYWVVDPEEHVVEQYVLKEERYELIGRQTTSITARPPVEATVDLTKVW